MTDINKSAADKGAILLALGWLATRLQEPSSYVGIVTVVLAAFHLSAIANPVVSILVGIGGVLAFVLPERALRDGAAVILLALAIGFALFGALATPAVAADAPPATAPALAPLHRIKPQPIQFLVPAVCTAASCPSFYTGGILIGLGGNANLIGGGLNNSIFQGGGMIGLDAGYRYWNGSWYFGGEVAGLLQSQSGASVVNFAPGGFVGIVGVKLGGNAAAFFNQGTTTATQAPISIPAQLQSSLMAPYIEFADVIRSNGSEFASGAGAEFVVGGGWTFDAAYLYAPPINNMAALNLIKFGFNYNWK